MKKIKLFFLGTPEFAVPSLSALFEDSEIEILGLITQPDKPVGRKQILTASPCKNYALQKNIAIYQPENINKDLSLIELIKKQNPDYLVTVAYGQILKSNILELKPVINLHASLLPHYRGPAPINWMIIQDEAEIGLSTMLTDPGIDTGDVLLQTKTKPLEPNETAESLTQRLSIVGAELLIKTLKTFGSIKPLPQESFNGIIESKLLAPFINKELGLIDFKSATLNLKSANPRQKDFELVLTNSARNVHNLVRACIPWPLVFFVLDHKKHQVLETQIVSESAQEGEVGSIIASNSEDGSITVQCQVGLLKILKIKPESKSIMRAADWHNGLRRTLLC